MKPNRTRMLRNCTSVTHDLDYLIEGLVETFEGKCESCYTT